MKILGKQLRKRYFYVYTQSKFFECKWNRCQIHICFFWIGVGVIRQQGTQLIDQWIEDTLKLVRQSNKELAA